MKEIYKFATTSFIYYDTRLMNTLKLMHLFDEIELLYFESFRIYDQIEDNEISLLKRLNLEYCPHLPYDRNLNEKKDYKVMENFLKKLSLLPVSYFFLHSNGDDYEEIEMLSSEFSNLLVENVTDCNIFYELKNTSVNYCFDVGHAIVKGENPFDIISQFANKIKYIHLHGVKEFRDHQDLRFLENGLLTYIFDFAIENRVAISIEVFGFKKLQNSLNHLLEVFKKYGYFYHRWH